MRILLVNVPHPAIGSRIPDDHLPPLGLLSIGGPLIDDGHDVRLIDAEFGPMPLGALIAEIVRHRARRRALRPFRLDLRASGHRRSRARHRRAAAATCASSMAASFPPITGARFWRRALGHRDRARRRRGDGAPADGRACRRRHASAAVRRHRLSRATTARWRRGLQPVIRDLDAYRVGWELIDHARYSYWGGLRAVVVQFSRGCPHLCNYCGQRGFWTRWRHRDPVPLRQGDSPDCTASTASRSSISPTRIRPSRRKPGARFSRR